MRGPLMAQVRFCCRLLALAGPLLALAACEDRAGQEPRASFKGVTHDGLRPPVDTAADLYLGQLAANYSQVNLTDGQGVYGPEAIAVDVTNNRLYVADPANNRVLGWSSASAFSNGAAANLILGQTGPNAHLCNQGGAAATQSSLCSASGVAVDASGNLYVADTGNSRVLKFNSPFTLDVTADQVFGQVSYTNRSCNLGLTAPGASSLCSPTHLGFDATGNLFVVDQGNNRVLRFNAPLSDTVADAALGQADFAGKGRNRVDARGLYQPNRVTVDRVNNRVYVADTNNHRVLGWPSATAFANGDPATVVLGQADFSSNQCNRGTSAGQNTLCYPRGMAVDGAGNLFVADSSNSRVLVFNTPFTSDGLADMVYGQTTYTSTGCSASATGLCAPEAVTVSSANDVFIADTQFNRVLKFTGGVGGDTTADQVFGQAGSFTSTGSNNGGVSATSLYYPRGVAVDAAGNLYVADYYNSRVLTFLAAPSLDATADRVFGQAGSFTSSTVNLGGTTASSLYYAFDVSIDGLGNLWVSDNYNYRVLGYSSPTTDQVADVVLGKPNMTTNYCYPVSDSCTYYNSPGGTASDAAGNIFYADIGNNRVLRFVTPFSTNTQADQVLGQTTFTAVGENMVDAAGLYNPTGIAIDTTTSPNRLYVSDSQNYRVLGWSTALAATGAAADKVFGQPDFSSTAGGSGTTGLNYPMGLAATATNLYVADRYNSRVIEYDAPYAAGDTTPDRVLGQSLVTSGTSCNQGTTPSAASLCSPRAVAVDAAQNVWVSDSDNNRVVRYTTPWSTDRNADGEVGQLGFVQNGPNKVDPSGINNPRGLAIDRSVTPNRIFVVDSNNSRVLGWPDVTAFNNGDAATLVIGQPDMNASGCNNPTLGASSLCSPEDAAVDSVGRLYVSDRNNSRILIYNAPFTTDAVADKVLAQADFTSNAPNRGLACGSNNLYYPAGIVLDPANNLWVADETNNRALQFLNPWGTDDVADGVVGQANFTSCNSNRGGSAAANTLYYPHDVAWDATAAPARLYVMDRYNNRALAFDDPVVNGDADQVFGQSSLTATGCCFGCGSRFCYPQGGSVDALGNFYVSDTSLNRVLEFDAPRTTDNNADIVFGQTSITGYTCNQPSGQVATPSTLCSPYTMAFDSSNNMYVADASNNRVTVYFANNRPTANPLTLLPATAYTDAALAGTYSYADLDSDPEGGTVVTWYKNGVAQAIAGLSVSAALTTRGDTWYFTVRPRDGVDFGPLVTSATVTILNSLPSAAAPAIAPAPAKTNDVLTATYTFSDLDGDLEAGSTIRWYRNTVLQSAYNDSKTVPASATTKGDLWYFTVAPSDGLGSGTQQIAPTISIQNTAPTASALGITPASPAGGSSLTATYAYADADSDLEAGSLIRWYRNAALVGAYNDLKVVPAGVVVAGESWYYTLQPRDGTDLGLTYTSPTVLIGSSAPAASNVSITPNPAYVTTPLIRNYTFSDPDLGHTEVGSTTRWYKGGVLQSAYNDLGTIPTSQLVKGNSWYFTITPRCSSGLTGAMQTSPTLVISNSAPTASAPTLAPASPLTTNTLTATWGYVDADGDLQGAAQIKWFKNGVEQAALANLTTVSPSFTAKGENWYFTLQPFDGSALGALVTSNTVTVVNSVPVASGQAISPVSPRATDTLTASWTYTDADLDPQVGTEVRWYRNGAEDVSLFNALTVPPSKLVKGNTWYFRVKPKDNVAFGVEVQSPTVTVVNSPPVATSLAISPSTPPAGSPMVGSYTYADADGDAQTGSEIKWYKNGVEQVAYAGLLNIPSGVTAKGEQWYFTVRPFDGTAFGAPAQSATVTIANSAPTASAAAVSPNQPRTDDVLTATYAYADADGDVEAGSELHWFRNGTEVLALVGLKTVPAAQTTRGESWYFTIKPSDGTDFGVLVTASPVTILNTAPVASNINISPLSPKTTDAITGSYTFTDADSDLQQGSEVRWYKDGTEVPAYFNLLTVPAGVPRAGETWNFTVLPRDGVAFGALVTSTSVVVGSSAPVATALQITPFSPKGSDALVANYLYSDPDGQPESGSVIKWYRNGVEVVALADLRTVPAATARKGEQWYFTVRPSDGATPGALQTSPTVTILNTAPTATNPTISPATTATDDVLTAVYSYSDIDLDSESGSEIRWYKNGLEQSALLNQATVAAALTRKNEVWYYRVRPSDGADFGPAEVSTPAFIANSAPVANAGPDQSLTPTRATVRVTLDGRATTDADSDVLSYTWAEGATVLGSGSTVPIDLPLGPHTLTLSVSDGDDTSTDSVLIDIANPKPLASVPASFDTAPGRVVLKGVGTENLGRTLAYLWTQLSGDPVTIDDSNQATASYFALKSGPRSFRLVVTADGTPSDPADLTVTTRNEAPAAAPVPRRVVRVGAATALDGTASDDPNADPLTFLWALDATGASTADLTDATLPRAGFTANADGRYVVRLTVNDGVQDSSPSLGEVLALDPAVTQHAPVANAGADGVAEVGRALALDGRLSFDADGDALSYSWRRIAGPAGELTRGTTSQPGFKPSSAGTLVLGLVVGDGKVTSAEDTVSFEVNDPAVNGRPVARAQGDGTATVGGTVQLDGTRSTDPDGDALTWSWTQLDGVKVSLSDAAVGKPTFTALRPGAVRLQLVVSDGTLSSAPSVVTVLITTAPNRPPVANAGVDQAVQSGTDVQLDGSASTDPDGDTLRFAWEQLAGPPVVLEGASDRPTFTPPGLGRYRFRLVVRDGETPSLPDEVEVAVATHGANNQPPVAVAGPDQDVAVSAPVTLDGTGSHDPDPQDRLTYEWTFVAFPTGVDPALDNPAGAQPTFTPVSAGPYTLKLVVSDGDLVSQPSYVTVVALTGGVGAGGCGCSEAPGATFWLLTLLALGWAARARRPQPVRVQARPRTRGTWALLLAVAVAVPQHSAEAKSRPPAAKKKVPKKGDGKPAATDSAAQPEAASDSAGDAPVAEPPGRRADAPTGAPAAGPAVPNPYLDEARQMYSNFQLEGLVSKLEFALAVKGINEDQKVEIFKLMAFTHASFDDGKKAEEAFLRLLEVRPKYELTGASPKIRQFFSSAQRQHREMQAVKLQHSPPRATSTGATTTLDVVAVSGADRVAQMTLHYRPEGGELGYSQTDMQAGENGAFSAAVPNIFPGPAGRRKIEYFVRARDKGGALLAGVGEESRPLVVEVETVEAVAKATPVYKTGWFWAVTGVVVAGAVAGIATPLLLKKDAVPPAGTLGSERLP